MGLVIFFFLFKKGCILLFFLVFMSIWREVVFNLQAIQVFPLSEFFNTLCTA